MGLGLGLQHWRLWLVVVVVGGRRGVVVWAVEKLSLGLGVLVVFSTALLTLGNLFPKEKKRKKEPFS